MGPARAAFHRRRLALAGHHATIATVAAPLTAAIGCYGVAALAPGFRRQAAFEFGTMLSFAIPGTVVGISYILAFNVPLIELTGTAAILVICFVFRNMPVGVRAGIATLSQIDKSLCMGLPHPRRALSATTIRRVAAAPAPAIVAALVYSFVRAMTAVSADPLVSAEYNIVDRVHRRPGRGGRVRARHRVFLRADRHHAGGDRPDPARCRRAGSAPRGRGDAGNRLMVEFKNVTKRYGAVTAVNDISFRIEPGTPRHALGPRAAARRPRCASSRLEMVSSGSITIGGRDVTSAPARSATSAWCSSPTRFSRT